MPNIEFEGQVHYVPGVYTATKVATSLPGPLPAFQIPVLLGRGHDGHPYNADDLLVLDEPPFSPFSQQNTDTAAADYYGEGSEIHRAMSWAKRHGLPFAFVCNLSPMTRASLIADTLTTDIEQYTLYPRRFGPIGGWIKVGHSSGVLTIVPVKRYAMLAANLGSTAVRAYFDAPHDWLTVGAAVTIGSNTVAGVARTITAIGTEMQASGQIRYWAEISSAVGSAVLTAGYGLILQYDTAKTVTTSAFTTSQQQIDYFNQTSTIFRAVKHANFTGALPADILTALPIKEVTAWNTATPGTAPAPTGSDVAAFITRMNAGDWGKFAVNRQLLPQTYLLVDSSSTNHGKMRDYAIAERTRGYPISVTCGCAWGDTVIGAGDSTDPTFRAAALNSQDVALCAGGLDREAAYISTAAAVWARRVAGGPGHNLTNDELIFSVLEKAWDEINSGQLSTLCKKGVISQKLSIGDDGNRYKVSQGLSTNQANAGLIWNTSDSSTWAVMQRDLADFVDRVLKTVYEGRSIGADQVDANALAGVLNRVAQKSLVKKKYILTFTVTSIELNDAGNGYDVQWTVTLPTTNDFITVTTTILVG